MAGETPEVDNDALLAEVDAALGIEHEPAEDAAPNDAAESADTGTEGEAEGAHAEAEGEAESAKKPEAGDDKTDEAGRDSEGRERNPDGTFKPKGEKEQRPSTDPKDKALNDPIPKDLKQETKDRIKTLIDRNREADTKYAKLEQSSNQLVQRLASTGAAPEQMNEILTWTSKFYSKDPTQMRAAYDELDTFLNRFALVLGIQRTGGEDPLKEHADLQKAVAEGKLTKEYATEIATTRNSTRFRGELDQQARQETETRAAAEKELADAKSALDELEAGYARTDPQWAAKRAILVQTLQPVFKMIPPRQWKAAFEQAYSQTKVAAPMAARGAPRNQPLRPKPGAGTQRSQPGSVGEVLDGIDWSAVAQGKA